MVVRRRERVDEGEPADLFVLPRGLQRRDGLRGEDVIKAVQQHPADEFLVTSGEDVVGVLHLADLVQMLDPRTPRSRL